MRTPKRAGKNLIELQMTPMIDVVFLLLVFFLWTSSFDLPEFDLPSSLAEPPAGLADASDDPPPPEAFDELVITVQRIRGSGDAISNQPLRLGLNGDAIENVDQLRGRLAQIVNLGAQPPVIVDPEDGTDIGAVVQIYDLARDVGLNRVLFAADE